MSDTGNFEFSQDPEPASDQPAPGWYFAQGDPPGTERYWNGTAWEGTYRAVGGFSPTEVVKPPDFPGWAKVLAWILSILKALPLIALGALVVLWGAITQELENEIDFEFREFSIAVLLIGGAIVVAGTVLLLGQLIAVSKEQPGRAAVWSGILTAIDAVFAVSALFGGGLNDAGLFIGLVVVQGGLFAGMVTLWKNSKELPA